MNVDLRGFDYALEPLRRRYQWQLDALQAGLGKIQKDIRRAETQLGDLKARYLMQSQLVVAVLTNIMDPGRYTRQVHWLAQQRQRIAVAENELDTLCVRRTEITAKCVAQQQRLDAIERDREAHLSDFVCEEQRRLVSEADREWLARRHWSATNTEIGETEHIR